MIRLSWCSIVCYIVCLAMKMSLKSRRRKCFSQPALTWYSSILLFTGGDKCQAFTEDWCFSLRDLKVRRDGDNNLFVLCTEYLAADVPISTSVKLGEVSGVELVSICEAYATTPLDFLWHNISTPPVTALQMSRCEVCVCVEVPTFSANN